MHADEQLDHVKQMVSEYVRQGDLNGKVEAFLDNQLASHGYGKKISGAANPELDKVVQRIRALQAKKTDQGCTEEEALAAAKKVAELLDRYGLELTETSVLEIGCEALRYDTGRKRRNDTDLLCTAVAHFFDCKGWLTKNADQEIQYIIFGFKADAEAALLLIERIYDIIDNATQQFKTGSVYSALSGSRKRTASSSFQAGMAAGIMQKLGKLKADRIKHANNNTGTSLVLVKESMIVKEINSLGLSMRILPESQAMIHTTSFRAGEQTGLAFSPDEHLE